MNENIEVGDLVEAIESHPWMHLNDVSVPVGTRAIVISDYTKWTEDDLIKVEWLDFDTDSELFNDYNKKRQLCTYRSGFKLVAKPGHSS